MAACCLCRNRIAFFVLSVVASGMAHAAATTDCRSTLVGSLETRTFQSITFGDRQTLRIWLPPGYSDAASATRRYAVLYMMDGQNFFDVCTAGGDNPHEWRIDETLTKLIADDSIEPLVVVGIDTPGERRANEYLPYPDPLFPNLPKPHGDRFPDFLASEVLPLVSKEFRVRSGPQYTAIGGSSYGAVAALYAPLRRPDLFGLGLLESPSLQVGNGQLLRDVTQLAVGPRRVSIGVGTLELEGHESELGRRGMDAKTVDAGIIQLTRQLAADLRAASLNRPEVLLVVDAGAQHGEQFWAQRFPKAIQFLFSKSRRGDGLRH